ncbi:MAG TPA: serine/threonine-protein kinase [Bryobacteraceae bacterium]|jgi:tetratricopeptide (TPR) repeat protein/predicted Ser/Thr protein kinase|nr:serine/threonine-protein kinase [Bryobacteraceae bacterium]
MMDSARWSRVQNLFGDAVDLPPAEQQSFLDAECGADQALMDQVRAMIEEDSKGDSLLDRGVSQVANHFLGDAPTFKQAGPYRMVRMLGEGGMGVVYLAERDDLGSAVAIKILRDAWLSPARRERFLTEQRTLAQLNHPSIARLYDANTLPDGTPWFAMEYVEGVPLTKYCEPLATKQRLQLFREVCEAVQHAHLHAVIHRDLKPSNVLVRPDGSVRLLDFGIAKQLDRFDTPADKTRTGLRLMTPAYAAPEQIRGERIGVYTDVYSLGVVLYELLAGKLPFDLSDRTPGESERIILEQEPEKPSSIADLNVLCLTAMHEDPERRYSSVEALIRDIDHYLGGQPLEAQRDTLRYRARKFIGRNRRAVTAAAAVLTLVIGMVAFFTVRLAVARNRALAEAARTQRIQRFMLNLFEGGDKESGPGDNLRVITMIDRGVLEAQDLSNEPAVQAELYQTLGSIYQKLGKLDRADTLLNSGLERRRSLFGNDSAEAAESLIALGLLRVDQERLPEAERLVREGLDMTRRRASRYDPALAKATTALGRVLEERGSYKEAVPVLEEAVRLSAKEGPVNADLTNSLNELASVDFYAGRYKDADALFRRVLQMHRQLHGDRHPLVADDLINIGAVQLDLGYYSEAEKLERQALEINQSYYGSDHPQMAHNLTVLGRTLINEKRFDEAVAVLEKALPIEEQAYGPVSRQVASALNELGNAAMKRLQYDEAEPRFRRMVDIYRSVYNNHHYLIGIALSNLAGVYMGRKEYVRAEQLYTEAIQMFAETLPTDHINMGIAQIKLGRTLLRELRYTEAEAHLTSGYAILAKQASPSLVHLQNARQDLASVYDALKQPGKAQKFRETAAK